MSMKELADPRLGSLLGGRYRLEECLGAGAMGAVYRATALGNGQTVAVKLLHEGFALQPNFVKRFEREAEAMARLSHPHLTRVLDSGVEGTTPFLVMEYHRGRSLDHVLKEGAIEPVWAVALTRQILEGIHHAHESGVVHRDLKPENIILLEGAPAAGAGRGPAAPVVKILDFGLAKFMDGEESVLKLTQTGTAMGTPYYMSPEQALGSSVDLRSDIYAVGVILYEMVVGRPPFYAENPMAVLRMHLDKPPVPLRQAAPECGVSEALEVALLRSLAKEPEHRWQTAEAFAAALAATAEADSLAAAKPFRSLQPLTPSATPAVLADAQPGAAADPAKPIHVASSGAVPVGDPTVPGIKSARAAASPPKRSVAPDPAQTALVSPPGSRAPARPRSRRRLWAWAALVLLGGGGVWVGLDPAARRALGIGSEGQAHGPIEPRPTVSVLGGSAGSEPGTRRPAGTRPPSAPNRAAVEGQRPAATPPSASPAPSPSSPAPAPQAPAGTASPVQAPPAAPADHDAGEDDGVDEPMPQDTPGAQLERQAAQPGAPQRPATVRHAGQLIAKGQLDEGLEELYAVRRRSPRDADAALLLGHAYFRKNWRSDGLHTYAEAIVLRRSLRTDKPLQRNVIRSLDDPTYRLARGILLKYVGAAAVPELRQAAARSDNPKVKKRAALLLDQIKPPPAPAKRRRK
ncbi:MAG TPA: protein kinase [Polyangia bacterium]|nr:protein kinase [Polyangia bacterium]